MTDFQNEKIFQKRNMENRKNIRDDAVKAKANAVSYGRFKAGLGPEYEETDYHVSSTDYLVRKEAEVKDEKKTAAFIK